MPAGHDRQTAELLPAGYALRRRRVQAAADDDTSRQHHQPNEEARVHRRQDWRLAELPLPRRDNAVWRPLPEVDDTDTDADHAEVLGRHAVRLSTKLLRLPGLEPADQTLRKVPRSEVVRQWRRARRGRPRCLVCASAA